jgi:hypothetical protein
MSFPLMPNIMPQSPVIPTTAYVSFSATNQGGTFTVPSPTSANRFIVYVTTNQTGSVSLTSCTIAGVAASVASSGNASFACALVPTGTSIVITPTYASGAGTSTAYTSAVYVAYDLESPIWMAVGFNAGNAASVTLTVPEKGLVFVPVQADNDNQTVTFSSPITSDVDGNNGASRGYASGHANAFTSGQSYTATASIGTANGLGCYMGVGVLR